MTEDIKNLEELKKRLDDIEDRLATLEQDGN